MLMLNHNQYTMEEMLSFIQKKEAFSGDLIGAGLHVKIEEYLPVVCTAIHAGKRLRNALQNQCVLSKEERYFEEDPFTDDMIASQPITLIGLDSRFEYDLNRALTLSISYRTAWDRVVWKKPLSTKNRLESHRKHNAFYTIYEAIITKLESLHNSVMVFDIHSYNYKRQRENAPVFNIGTAQIDMERWGSIVNRFNNELNKIQLPHLATTVENNGVFEGRGYLIAHTNAHFDRTLVLPTEVKKVFMNEESGVVFPLVLEALQSGLKEAFSQTSAYLQRKHNKKSRTYKSDMLSSFIEPSLVSVDKQLYRLANKVETLKYVTPTNIGAEYKRFEAAPHRYKPNYRYRQLPINVNEFKQNLYRLSIENISDPDIRQLYADMVQKLSDKMDLLTSVGTESFLYNALRYHGRPDKTDINNAQFLLYAKPLPEQFETTLDAQQAVIEMSSAAQNWGMKCRVTTTNSIAAKAMVTASPMSLMLNAKAKFTDTELKRLIQHELGVHMATNHNAKGQPLNIFRLGLPGSTMTQEGLAILAEYNSGYLSHLRLNTLAARVIAVDSMLKEQNFYRTFSLLVDEFMIDKDTAFSITTRVYRGGGFTKDHLYLKGFVRALDTDKERKLEGLFTGKCSFHYHDLIDELVNRRWLKKPIFVPNFKETQPSDTDHQLNYLIDSLRVA